MISENSHAQMGESSKDSSVPHEVLQKFIYVR